MRPRSAGAVRADAVRVPVGLADRADVRAVVRLPGRTVRGPRPTTTTVIYGFAVPEMRVEPETTARWRRSGG
jgi:hypothetical protein